MRHQLSAQSALSTRQRIHQFVPIPFATHRSFSANCFLAKNSLDFTVPIGIPSMPETSSSVYPSIAASSSTNRNFSGNSSIARSNRSWNSLDTANSSTVGPEDLCSGASHWVSRFSLRFAERQRSSAIRNAIRSSHPRNRAGSRSRSKFRYSFSKASCSTSSASAAFRKTPYATRNANGPHSASRSSNSPCERQLSLSRSDGPTSTLPAWVRTSSRILNLRSTKLDVTTPVSVHSQPTVPQPFLPPLSKVKTSVLFSPTSVLPT